MAALVSQAPSVQWRAPPECPAAGSVLQEARALGVELEGDVESIDGGYLGKPLGFDEEVEILPGAQRCVPFHGAPASVPALGSEPRRPRAALQIGEGADLGVVGLGVGGLRDGRDELRGRGAARAGGVGGAG